MARLVLNGYTIGRLGSENGDPKIKLDGEFREQFAAVEPYANVLFANMGETLAAAIPPERRTQV